MHTSLSPLLPGVHSLPALILNWRAALAKHDNGFSWVQDRATGAVLCKLSHWATTWPEATAPPKVGISFLSSFSAQVGVTLMIRCILKRARL
ncbi:hypothetical protein EDB85DRAFT_904248 [Lactarius pseudohatsudake]|nr:hypothetical protein EDB85DRAFT_904248 [Lactarius pseudohatsudake]